VIRDLALLSLLLGGCSEMGLPSGSDGPANPLDGTVNVIDMARPPIDLARPPLDLTSIACTEGCIPCPQGYQCMGGFPGEPWPATCIKQCKSDDDCPSTEACVWITSQFFAPYCIGLDNVSDSCAPCTMACAGQPPFCLDSATLNRPYVQPQNCTCGIEYVRCPNGCVQDTGMQIAHCQ
jgi:hypothetical protein